MARAGATIIRPERLPLLPRLSDDTNAEAVLKNKLIVFVKAPRPGEVKTRLATSIGAEAACEAYRKLVAGLLAKLTSLDGVELRFAPDDAEAEIRPWSRTGWQLAPQGGGDLGMRLQVAFESALHLGAKHVVVIGSDCPDVTAADIQRAWEALQSHDVVIGPASDGGYWLIGLNQPERSLFEGLAWSTDKVLAQTIERCRASGLRVKLLRELDDVDTEDDWRRHLRRAGE